MHTINNAKPPLIGLFALVMLITGAIDSIRNLPTTALFGSQLIFFFIFAAVMFLIPCALVSADLTTRHNKEGGIYAWVKQAFGPHIGFLAIWLQWINTMVWYPTMLSFIAGTAAFLIDPKLAQNKVYLVTVILSVFWGLTLMNLKGIRASARFAAICTLLGMILPMILIIGLGTIWLISGKPQQIHLTLQSMIPSMKNHGSWISLTGIMAAFIGIELATVHVNAVKNPQRQFPRAILISTFLILSTMICGSLAIAFVLPHNQINLVDGVMQVFSNFMQTYHLKFMTPVITIMLLLGSLGGLINWIISPAKGLLFAAQDGFLPPQLQEQNKQGVAYLILIGQAMLVSLICLVFLFMPSVNGSYWLLTDLSTELYVLMYALMFLSAFVLPYKKHNQTDGFQVPGGRLGLNATCLLGLMGYMITLVIGFFPPAGIEVGGEKQYEIIFALGLILFLTPVFGFYFYKNRQIKKELYA